MTYTQIPLQNTPQSFQIVLGGIIYNVTCKYTVNQGWLLDFADVDNNLILCAVPLTIGRNLLEPYGYLNFQGKLFVYSEGGNDVPTLDNLGTTSNLFFGTE